VLKRDPAEVEARARKLLDKVGIGDKCRCLARAAFGRPAAARRHRPRAVHGTQGAAVRRTDQRAGPRIAARGGARHQGPGGEHRTMLLVTHDMRLAADVSDHVVFLHQGRIEEEGTELFGNPKSERLRGFLSATAA
jgi:polar amino acid transport system ATP-binding protein